MSDFYAYIVGRFGIGLSFRPLLLLSMVLDSALEICWFGTVMSHLQPCCWPGHSHEATFAGVTSSLATATNTV
jgi:hypothetical protein